MNWGSPTFAQASQKNRRKMWRVRSNFVWGISYNGQFGWPLKEELFQRSANKEHCFFPSWESQAGNWCACRFSDDSDLTHANNDNESAGVTKSVIRVRIIISQCFFCSHFSQKATHNYHTFLLLLFIVRFVRSTTKDWLFWLWGEGYV